MKSTEIILLVYIIAIFNSSDSLFCYECNHNIDPDPNCDIININSTVHLNECAGSDEAQCLQLTIHGTSGVNITMRQCAELPTASWCEHLNNTRLRCELCDSDGCNNSPMEPLP